MPELPEVEVTRRAVEPLLVGRRIARVETGTPSYFFLTSPATLRKKLAGRRCERLGRRGKYMVAELDDGSRLLLHLGMTGQLLAVGARSRLAAHVHLCLGFAGGGKQLAFRDVRKFGKVAWIAPGASNARLDRLGTDALEVTGALIRRAARKRSASIKSLLLDQSVLAGVGNIYADEACFLSGIRPTRSARRLSRPECDRLALALRGVLTRAIARGGSSISDFVHVDGGAGSYQDERRVYGRAGEPCHACRTQIRRVVLAQRSTHFCPRCQG
jgi:formamidopyrimidine-DNA glycosylase